MEYIWNIYESLEPLSPLHPFDPMAEADPFDVFIYSQRMASEPHQGDCVYVEGRRCKVVACQLDRNMNDVLVQGDVVHYKVCVV